MPRSTKAAPTHSAAGQNYLQTVRQIALSFPGVEEGTSYGTPAFRVAKKFIARLWEDGQTLVIRIDIAHREILLAADPATFFITDHYRKYPAILVRLAVVHPAQLRDLIEESWRRSAPKNLLKSRQS
jgi:hypothetical protein